MGKLSDDFKKYLQDTPLGALEEFSYLNEIGPDVLKYAEDYYSYVSCSISYSGKELQATRTTLRIENKNESISSDADYYHAA